MSLHTCYLCYFIAQWEYGHYERVGFGEWLFGFDGTMFMVAVVMKPASKESGL